MGSLFAIPPDLTAESIVISTVAGRKLFYTLQNYGLYFTEDAAWDTWDVIVERGVEEEFLLAYGFSMKSDTWKDELNRLMQALSVIDNNAPEFIGGGGDPLAPLAPEFTPANSNPYVDPMIPLLLAGEREKLPVAGELLYDCENLGVYSFTSNNGATKKIVEADSSNAFGLKFQLDVKIAGNNAWEPQFQSPVNTIAINKGDVLLYVFFIRTNDTEFPNDFGKGDVDVDDLPTNDVTYEGMEPDAAWRSDAEARIEQYRKSNVTLRITDGDGNLVENASVTIKMKDHAFGFGNFPSDMLLDATSDGDKYRKHVLEMFNAATTPFYMGGNGDDWEWYGTGTSQEDYPAMAAWLQQNGVPTKGHVLVWPGWNWMPSFFEELAGDPEGLRAAIDEHFETIVPIGSVCKKTCN